MDEKDNENLPVNSEYNDGTLLSNNRQDQVPQSPSSQHNFSSYNQMSAHNSAGFASVKEEENQEDPKFGIAQPVF